MAPKKKQNAKPKSQPSSSGQISAENEKRLRRLLLNSGGGSGLHPQRLKTVYEKLSCEGFSNSQIELALSAL